MAKQHAFVYSGYGANEKHVQVLLAKLRQHLCPRRYTVSPITPEETIKGDWKQSAAVYAIGGGFDLGFIKALGQRGVQQIRNYVAEGGRYLGICAGAYFASDCIEFDKNGPLQVCGERHLRFFPGVCVGPVYGPYNYDNFSSACIVTVSDIPVATRDETTSDKRDCNLSSKIKCYFNGGGLFLPHGEFRCCKIKKSAYACPDSCHIELLPIGVNCDQGGKIKDKHVLSVEMDPDSAKNGYVKTVPENGLLQGNKVNVEVTRSDSNELDRAQEAADNTGQSYRGLDESGTIQQVLGRYHDISGHPVATVKCSVVSGIAVLTGLHPELCSADLDAEDKYLQPIVKELKDWDSQTDIYFRSLCQHLELNTNI